MSRLQLSAQLANKLANGIESLLAAVPRSRPTRDQLAHTRIVSHRGERDNYVVFENTFAAFDTLIDAGVWGIEFDVRWTRDLEPVVIHDLDLLRVFSRSERIADLTLAQLRERAPEIPPLADLIDRYGGKLHLMMELKEALPDASGQATHLRELLADLEPVRDFHVLSLNTDLFRLADGLPPACWLPVARSNVRPMSRFALAHGCAGMAGPYPFVSAALARRHHTADQSVGTGFPAHRNTLFHAACQGVRWVFTNEALRMQSIRDEALAQAS